MKRKVCESWENQQDVRIADDFEETHPSISSLLLLDDGDPRIILRLRVLRE